MITQEAGSAGDQNFLYHYYIERVYASRKPYPKKGN